MGHIENRITMTIWVTSDLHLNHRMILEYCPKSRGHFSDHIHMTEHIIGHWNTVVQPDDIAWIIGDVSMGDPAKMYNNISRLNGHLHLVSGNHDHKILRDPNLVDLFDSVQSHKKFVYNCYGKDVLVNMNHEPMQTWDGMLSGSVMLHGHKHSTNPDLLTKRIYDVGIDGHPNFSLYNLDSLLYNLLGVPIPTQKEFRRE